MMRKSTMLGAAAVLVTGAAGYFLLVAPQALATAAVNTQLADLQTTNSASAAQIPVLKAKLKNISGTVSGLRELSGKVPPAINLPSLYQELDAVAAQAGQGVSVTNVSVTIPALLTPPVDPAAVAAAAATASKDNPATPAPAPAPAAKKPAGSAVLASYKVDMTIAGTPAQAAAFLKALGATKRMNVVSTSGFEAGAAPAPGAPPAPGTARVSSTFYLQQVDVDGLAAQIESLASAGSGVSPNITKLPVPAK